MPINKVVLIGAGRVATQLGQVLSQRQIRISQVYSRTMSSAKQLAAGLDSKPETDLSQLDRNADLYIISVADDAIAEVVRQMHLPGKIIVHTSGSVEMEALGSVSEKHGVFYPLNTFSKSRTIDLFSTPICVEANDKNIEKELVELGRLISGDVRLISSQQRAVIHLAAVFACNFTNFMIVNADEILKNAGLDFDIMLPLINETISKLRDMAPKNAQTGPAVRNDHMVLQKHLEMLKDDPGKREIYDAISKEINSFFNSKK